jgi:hypothetical protein
VGKSGLALRALDPGGVAHDRRVLPAAKLAVEPRDVRDRRCAIVVEQADGGERRGAAARDPVPCMRRVAQDRRAGVDHDGAAVQALRLGIKRRFRACGHPISPGSRRRSLRPPGAACQSRRHAACAAIGTKMDRAGQGP